MIILSKRFTSQFDVKGLLLAAGLLIILAGCSSSSVDPGPGLGPAKNYQLITVINEVEGDFLAIFDVPADTLIDTVNIGNNFNSLAIRPDLSRVFVSSLIQNKTIVYSLDSMSVDTTLPWQGVYYFDEVRNKGIRVNSSGIYTFDLSTYSPGTSVAVALGASTADIVGGMIYLSSFSVQITSKIYQYDYVNDTLVNSFTITDSMGTDLFVSEMLLLPESNRLYCYGENVNGSFAVIYDINLKKVVSQVSHRVPIGNFAKSSDGLSVYKSDPDLSSVLTSGKIWRYNISSDMIVSNLSTVVSTSTGDVTVSVTPMVFTPDGRFLYSSGTTVSIFDGVLLKHSLSDGLPSLVPTDLTPRGTMLMVMGAEILPDTTGSP